MWFNYKLEAIEVFLSRTFSLRDKYTEALERDYTGDWDEDAKIDHALDMVIAYEDIAIKAVYGEMNALVELEIKNLASSIQNKKVRVREKAQLVIEKAYGIKLADLPGYQEVEEVRRIMNAYKHDDGFSKPSEMFDNKFEEIVENGGSLYGYWERRYPLIGKKAFQSIQAVREFMRALPGERQRFPEYRIMKEEEVNHLNRGQIDKE